MTSLNYRPKKGNGLELRKDFPQTLLELDVPRTLRDTISTLTLSTQTEPQFSVDVDNAFPELYRFNNSVSLTQHVVEDTINPSLFVFVDSAEALPTMSVARKPNLLMYFTDNSRMPITDAWRLELTINARTIGDKDTTYTYRFYPSAEVNSILSSSLQARAALTVRPTLEFGTNNVSITATDYFNNSVTKKYVWTVSADVLVDQALLMPNPISETATLRYVIKSPTQNKTVRFEVYNARGERVRSQDQAARIGENRIVFDTRDDGGNLLMQGAYYYRVYVLENGSLDAQSGMMTIVR